VKFLVTVTGNIPWDAPGITDAHNHVWIDTISGIEPTGPVLNRFDLIARELLDYASTGGSALVDCQPGECGRNAVMLTRLSKATTVTIISATGFHRPVYYPPDHWLWMSPENQISDYFIQELTLGERETLNTESPVKAGFIKIACENTVENTYLPALHAAAHAARETDRAIEIHTEKGESAIEILDLFLSLGVDPRQVILCHMDKRPDAGLHRELIQAGAALEYDTFFRTKYAPETNLWPLIREMIASGLENHVCLATDLAESNYWQSFGGAPGLSAFPTQIKQRLEKMGVPDETIQKLLGKNICRILATEIRN
jgi:phosphotriesterase-related protein